MAHRTTSATSATPTEEMVAWQVGKAVGNVRNEGPELIEPVAAPTVVKLDEPA